MTTGPNRTAPTLLPEDLPASPADLLALATTVASEVATRLIESVDQRSTHRGPVIETKSSTTDLVTDLDRWSEAHITEQLLKARPNDAIVGEEGAAVSGTSGITWCIDPIDGTVNFVHGIPGFCVSIAAQVAGQTVAAAVLPAMQLDLFEATLGGGAFHNGRQIRCSNPASLTTSLIGTGFSYDAATRRRQAQVLVSVIDRIADIRRGGAAAIDLCWVACGRLDGYWELGLNPWDHAAASLVATEAGARFRVIEATQDRLSYTVAASPAIWDDLDALLNEVGAADC